MTDAEPMSVSVRGLPEWLIREYLIEMGAHATDDPTAMEADAWSVSWGSQRVGIAGGTLALTQFDLVFVGQDLDRVFDEFMKKAQRGGG